MKGLVGISKRINNTDGLWGVIGVIWIRWDVIFRVVWGMGVKVLNGLTLTVFRVVDGRGFFFEGDFVVGGEVLEVFDHRDVVDPLECVPVAGTCLSR